MFQLKRRLRAYNTDCEIYLGSETTEAGDEEEGHRRKKGGKAKKGSWIEAFRRLVFG